MIYLLRHGQTRYNAEHRIQGQCDSPLTALGREQARGLGLLLKDALAPGDAWEMVSSPLGRAVATAEIVRDHAGVPAPLVTDPLLMEIGCGSWERRLRAECVGDGSEGSFMTLWRHHCPDGEPYDSARARAMRWLEQADGRKVVAVAHGIMAIFLRGLYLGLDDSVMVNMPVPQDRIFRLHDGTVEELVLAQG